MISVLFQIPPFLTDRLIPPLFQMIAVISQCEMTVDKLAVVKQMNQQEADNYAKLHKGWDYIEFTLLIAI